MAGDGGVGADVEVGQWRPSLAARASVSQEALAGQKGRLVRKGLAPVEVGPLLRCVKRVVVDGDRPVSVLRVLGLLGDCLTARERR